MAPIAAVLATLVVPAAAAAGPTATLTIDAATIPAPAYSGCEYTARPDGTASGACGDGLPSTAQQLPAPPGAVARIRLSDPVGIGGASLGDPVTYEPAAALAVRQVDPSTYEVVVPELTRPMLLFFGGRWAVGASWGDTAYAALLTPVPPALVAIERRAGRGPRVMVALHAAGRVTARLRGAGRLLGRGERTLGRHGEVAVTVRLTRAGRRLLHRRGRVRASLTITARQIGVAPVAVTRAMTLRRSA
jgi:hypothetical protein